MSGTEKLQEKISAIRTLPTLPQVATKLMSIIRDPNSSSKEVANLVGQDISLSARVLRLANSAFYGMPRSISNLSNAVVILGTKVIGTMVVSLTVFDMFPHDKSDKVFNHKAFWKHGLGCGMLAKLITSRIRQFTTFDPEEAFCAGLLHDLGKIVMEQYLHEDFHTALALTQKKGLASYEAEIEALEYTHCDVAEWLTRSWDLPVEIMLPMNYHHNPSQARDHKEIVAVTHLADSLCYEIGLSSGDGSVRPTLDVKVVERLRIEGHDLDEVKSAVLKEVDSLSAILLG